MRIDCVGGGPAGLYAALLLKRGDPRRNITVIDRNPPGATYGWGVVFSDETLGFLEEADSETYADIARSFVHWDAIDIHYRGSTIRSGGHAFSGLARTTLLRILQDRCRDLGVELRFEQEADDLGAVGGADLVLAADGVNSRLRTARAEVFRPSFDVHSTKYVWWGVERHLDAFTFDFRRTEWGMFQVHAYPFGGGLSTCIVECNEATWMRAGLDRAGERESAAFCEAIFSEFLQGRRLLSNRSTWVNFVTVHNDTWHHGNLALIGDAAHTAHFSIGSGTKMAMEDAIALAGALDRHERLDDALVSYEESRMPVVERTQTAARESSLWFEHAERYATFQPEQFAFSLLTRSKRITYDNLAERDSGFIAQMDRWFATEAGAYKASMPLHVPYALAETKLGNRLATMAALPECQDGGLPAEGAAALTDAVAGGSALVLAAPLAVSAEARISPADPGLYSARQEEGWRVALTAAHRAGSSFIGCVLGHAGPRGATCPRSEGVDLPLAAGAWPLLAASAVRYSPYAQVPRAADRSDLHAVREQFTRAACAAARAGFDVLGLDFSHGYLVATFLSPLTNRRGDEYGASLQNRLRFPLEVLASVRETWPRERPLFVTYSVSDWHAQGTTESEAVAMARAFREGGCAFVHVASGQTVFRANPTYGRAWEARLADLIRNEAGVPVLVGGNVQSSDEANTLLAAGRTDLCLLPPGYSTGGAAHYDRHEMRVGR
jgi:anthraniloyl-CoA monooxygenase